MSSNRRTFLTSAASAAFGFGLAVMTGSASPAAGAKERRGRSLHIGLNRVDPDAYAGWSGRLRGCENDSRDLAAIAQQTRFDPQVPLITKDATIQAVKDEIKNAAAALEPGDIFLLTYSGHGGYIPDPSDPPIKPSRMSDTWCLYDGEIIDHELYNAWSDFQPEVRILVFSDSCHSGTVIRDYVVRRDAAAFRRPAVDIADCRSTLAEILDLPSTKAPSATDEPISTIRGIPRGQQEKVLTAHKEYGQRVLAAAKARKEKPVKCSVLLISGCQDNETSGDGPQNGLFTSAVKSVWANGSFQGDYHYFHQSILYQLRFEDQHPNYYTTGVSNPEFEKQRPFTL